MYTEDDEEVEVKSDNSNTKYSDFYTSFNDIDESDKKKKKGKKKKTEQEENIPKDEEDYQYFYGNNDDIQDNESDSGEKNIIKLIIVGVLLLIFVLLIIFVFVIKGNKVKGDIELDKTAITLDIGKKEYISYKVIDTESKVTSKFVSSDEAIAVVSDTGEITGIGIGDATITIYYTIDGVTREKKCTVTVNNDGSVDQNISLALNLSGGKENTWTNSDVTITPQASSVFGIATIKYGINCTTNCEYKDITDDKITISSTGITKVTIIAKDKKNQAIKKDVTIKIDKEAPSVTLNGDTNIKSTKDVEVCVTCKDSLSGCKQNKVCKKYSTSKSNQTITVEDNAGNKSTSKSFNVTINKVVAPCTLRVASDGTVTATVRDKATYYGFNSSYSGSNQTTKKINISDTKKGSYAQVIYYYVKNENGTGGKCFLTVIKKCVCTDNTNDSNCATTCTYSSQ